jgi:hypothetical protein
MQDGHDNNSLVFQVGRKWCQCLSNGDIIWQLPPLGTDNTFINQYGTANNAWPYKTGDNHLSTVNQWGTENMSLVMQSN